VCELSDSTNRCTANLSRTSASNSKLLGNLIGKVYTRFRNPESFGRTEAHASHGRFTPAAKLQSRATIESRISAGLPLDGGESEGNPVALTHK
jgi:hypothetical protein